MRIRLSRGIIIDLKSKDVVSDGLRLLITGESGSGKSTAATLIVEQVISGGGQVVLLDPHAEYASLRGVDPGSTAFFGYGDTPVTHEKVTEYLDAVHSGKSVLIDLSNWALEPAELSTFVLSFVKGLYRLRVKEPKWTLLVVEEAQLFCPQQQVGGQAEGIQLFVGVANGGRKHGLGLMLLSQRVSLVDSNVVGSANFRIFLRTSEVRDWKRVRQYIPESMGLDYYDMKNLKSGEAIVLSRWTPEAKVRLLQPSTALRKAQL